MVAYNFETDSVTVSSQSGTGFTVDVTDANLSPDLNVKDFLVFVNDVLNTNGNWQKTSRVQLTYVGTSLTNANILIRRNTIVTQFQQVEHLQSLSSTLWNTLVGSLIRLAEEYQIYGVGPEAISGGGVTLLNTPYSSSWDDDVVNGATRNALYDIIETKADLASPVFTGTPTVPDQAPGQNNQTIANTAYVDATFAPLASPVLTGAPSTTTPAKADSSTRIANTQHVKDVVADYAPLDSPALTGFPTAPTVGTASNGTNIATTAHVKNYLQASPIISTPTIFGGVHDSLTSAGITGTGTIDFTGATTVSSVTPSFGDNTTKVATTAFLAGSVGGSRISWGGGTTNFADNTWVVVRTGITGTPSESTFGDATTTTANSTAYQINIEEDGWYYISFDASVVVSGTLGLNDATYGARLFENVGAFTVGPAMTGRLNVGGTALQNRQQRFVVHTHFFGFLSGGGTRIIRPQLFCNDDTSGTIIRQVGPGSVTALCVLRTG